MSKTIGPYRLNPRGDYNPAADPLYSLLDLVSTGADHLSTSTTRPQTNLHPQRRIGSKLREGRHW